MRSTVAQPVQLPGKRSEERHGNGMHPGRCDGFKTQERAPCSPYPSGPHLPRPSGVPSPPECVLLILDRGLAILFIASTQVSTVLKATTSHAKNVITGHQQSSFTSSRKKEKEKENLVWEAIPMTLVLTFIKKLDLDTQKAHKTAPK